MYYKGHDADSWRRCGWTVYLFAFLISLIEGWALCIPYQLNAYSVENVSIALCGGLLALTIQILVQHIGSRQVHYAVLAEKSDNKATPAETAHYKQMFLWGVFVDIAIFMICYGVGLSGGNKLFPCIGLPILAACLVTILAFAIYETKRSK